MSNDNKKNPVLGVIIILVSILAYLFLIPFNSFDCQSNVCHVYKKNGLWGAEKIKMQFTQDEVISARVLSYPTKHHKHGYRHNHHKIIIKLKNEEIIFLPKIFCGNDYRVKDLAKAIKQSKPVPKQRYEMSHSILELF